MIVFQILRTVFSYDLVANFLAEKLDGFNLLVILDAVEKTINVFKA